MRKTKIVCTIGPACSTREAIESMATSGMNVARLNFSHETHEIHGGVIEAVKSVRTALQKPIAILLDTKGPQVRLGEVAPDCTVETGDKFTLIPGGKGNEKTSAGVNYPQLCDEVAVGARVLIDDGRIVLRVQSIAGGEIVCEVMTGGALKSHKSVNIPECRLNMPFLSDADKEDVLFGIKNDVDFIAASFVRDSNDVAAMRDFLVKNGGADIKIIAKIECKSAIDDFDAILRLSDGIMIARGDMGVEIDFSLLTGIQKRCIKSCYESGKTVITATQMLESMITAQTPTRAEITDVANAVFDGTSAVMLSGETAIGTHPDRVIEVMDKIVRQAEHDAFEMHVYKHRYSRDSVGGTIGAVCKSACETAENINAAAIINVCNAAESAYIASFRPNVSIVGATMTRKAYYQLALVWGVKPLFISREENFAQLFDRAVEQSVAKGYVESGDLTVQTAFSAVTKERDTCVLEIKQIK